MNKQELAKYIDHTLLKANATKEDVKKLCDEAKKYGFRTVFVHPYNIGYCKEFLQGTDILVGSVAGFPYGTNSKESKAFEAKDAVSKGAQEIDMVINIGALRDKKYDYVYEDVHGVVEACGNVIVKVILETCYLTDEEIVKASEICAKAGAAFVKTSTGFATGGAKVEHVRLMKQAVEGTGCKVKAAGGIRTYEDVMSMIEAGAERIGTSAGCGIIDGMKD